jgi:hypothetical protein
MGLHLVEDLIENHRRFIERAILNKEVWSIVQTEMGKPLLYPSNAEPTILVIPVWSDKAYAARHCNDEMIAHGYQPLSLELNHFINHDLYSFFKEGFLVGTNWNFDLAGLEKNPLELNNELVKAMLFQTQIKPEYLQNLDDCHALIYRLSQSLAYHVIETEFNLPNAPQSSQDYLQTEISKGKLLIEEAGFDIDALYQPESRPQS